MITSYYTRTLKDKVRWWLKVEGFIQYLLVYSPNGATEWDYQVLVPKKPLPVYTAEYQASTEEEFKQALQQMDKARAAAAKFKRPD